MRLIVLHYASIYVAKMLDGGAIYSEDILRTSKLSKFAKEPCSKKPNLLFITYEITILAELLLTSAITISSLNDR